MKLSKLYVFCRSESRSFYISIDNYVCLCYFYSEKVLKGSFDAADLSESMRFGVSIQIEVLIVAPEQIS